MWVKNITDFGKFCNLNILCLRINVTVILWVPQAKNSRISRKTQNKCFCWHCVGIRRPYWCSWKGHQHGVSIQSFINLGKPFFSISRIWNISQTWFLARVFVYLSFFISQILILLYWMVCIFIFHCVTVQAENEQHHKNTYLGLFQSKTDSKEISNFRPNFEKFRKQQDS